VALRPGAADRPPRLTALEAEEWKEFSDRLDDFRQAGAQVLAGRGDHCLAKVMGVCTDSHVTVRNMMMNSPTLRVRRGGQGVHCIVQGIKFPIISDRDGDFSRAAGVLKLHGGEFGAARCRPGPQRCAEPPQGRAGARPRGQAGPPRPPQRADPGQAGERPGGGEAAAGGRGPLRLRRLHAPLPLRHHPAGRQQGGDRHWVGSHFPAFAWLRISLLPFSRAIISTPESEDQETKDQETKDQKTKDQETKGMAGPPQVSALPTSSANFLQGV
jgi:hypothetical protein